MIDSCYSLLLETANNPPIDPLQVVHTHKRDVWPVNSAMKYGAVYALRQLGVNKEQAREQESIHRSQYGSLGQAF